ncbi:MAG: diguanylate cyclase [Azoarcus sp.]|jgi:diguanylate cyclase (GGDEF)-like protein|nr:diguanylate cyclase [Azoarcus sp.]
MKGLPSERSRTTQVLLRFPIIFSAYWVAWQTASLFEVYPHVSAFYASAGLTVCFTMAHGLIALPALYAAITLVQILDLPILELTPLNFFGPIREIAVYGSIGIYLRQHWNCPNYRFSLPFAVRVICSAFLASLFSTLLATQMLALERTPVDLLGTGFLSFWGGDFAGVMITVPAFIILHRLLRHPLSRNAWNIIDAVRAAKPLSVVLYAVFGLSVALFSVALPAVLKVDTRIGILILFPVVLAGLSRGAIVGFLVAAVACAGLLVAGSHFGFNTNEPAEVQLILALAAALALLAGAAHDDKEHAWTLATFDAVTGLPNRYMLMDRLDHALATARRTNTTVAVMYIDLDHFKAVNDTLGHHAGDQLLKQAGERIRRAVRRSDTVARLGGDEFVVVLASVDSAEGAEHVALNVLSALEEPFSLGARTAAISASIGVTVHPGNDLPTEDLLRQADLAMYQAKTGGRNRIHRTAQMHAISPLIQPTIPAGTSS